MIWQEQLKRRLSLHVHALHGRKAAHLERMVHISEMVEVHYAVLGCLTTASGCRPTAPAFGIIPSCFLLLTALANTSMCRAV